MSYEDKCEEEPRNPCIFANFTDKQLLNELKKRKLIRLRQQIEEFRQQIRDLELEIHVEENS